MKIAALSKLAMIAAAVGVLGAAVPASAQDAVQAPSQKHIGGKPQMVPSTGRAQRGWRDAKGWQAHADGRDAERPSSLPTGRSARRVTCITSEFIKQWGEGSDSFAKDPPNATISVFSSDGRVGRGCGRGAEGAPRSTSAAQTFDVSVLEGETKGADGAASLFIDWFAARGPAGGAVVHGGGLAFAGLARRLVRPSGAGRRLPPLSILRILSLSALPIYEAGPPSGSRRSDDAQFVG